jgi:putative phosphoesterase
MIAVLSDTHCQNGNGLSGRALEAVRKAGTVVHAGDFTTLAAFDAFRDVADRLEAVHGNRDAVELRDCLPAQRTVEPEGVRITLVHGHEHGETALSLLGKAEAADVVVSGHSHRPELLDTGDSLLLNPGSHADPRGNPAAHAELTPTAEGVLARLLASDGTEIDAATVY